MAHALVEEHLLLLAEELEVQQFHLAPVRTSDQGHAQFAVGHMRLQEALLQREDRVAPELILLAEIDLQVSDVIDVEYVLCLHLPVRVLVQSDVILLIDVQLRLLVRTVTAVQQALEACFEHSVEFLLLLGLADAGEP